MVHQTRIRRPISARLRLLGPSGWRANLLLYHGDLYWLGMVELASPEAGKDITAFRLLNSENLKAKAEDARVKVSSQGTITVPRYAPRGDTLSNLKIL